MTLQLNVHVWPWHEYIWPFDGFLSLLIAVRLFVYSFWKLHFGDFHVRRDSMLFEIKIIGIIQKSKIFSRCLYVLILLWLKLAKNISISEQEVFLKKRKSRIKICNFHYFLIYCYCEQNIKYGEEISFSRKLIIFIIYLI